MSKLIKLKSLLAATVAGFAISGGPVFSAEEPAKSLVVPAPAIKEIKAYAIDFNWGPGGPNGFSKPGLWADADPATMWRGTKASAAISFRPFVCLAMGTLGTRTAWFPSSRG